MLEPLVGPLRGGRDARDPARRLDPRRAGRTRDGDVYTVDGPDRPGRDHARSAWRRSPTRRSPAGARAAARRPVRAVAVRAPRSRPTPRRRPPVGRFVRVELPGKAKILSLAEVEVFSDGENVARGGEAAQSSTDYDGDAARAIDGNTDGRYFHANSTTHTRAEDNPWWEVQLAEPVADRADRRLEPHRQRASRAGWRTSACRCSTTTARSSGRPTWPSRPTRAATCRPPARAPLAFARAVADFAQDGLRRRRPSIDPKADAAKTGWAVAPRQKERHEAVFVLKEPLDGRLARRG